MNLRRILFLVFLSLGPPLFSQTTGPFVINSTANSQCASIDVGANGASVIIDVSGTFSMTLQPSESISGGTARNVQVAPVGSTTLQNTITTAGGYKAAVGGYQLFQLCASSYSSGTATVMLHLGQGVNASLLGSSGTSTVTSVSGDGTIINNSGSTGAVTLSLANTPTGTGGIVLATSPTFVGTVTIPTAAITTISGNPNFSGTPTGLTAAEVGLGSVTNDAQTKAAIVPNTAPAAGAILLGNAGGTAYASISTTGCTITSAGAVTCTPTAVGLSNVTNNAQTQAAIVPNTAPSTGQILAGNAGGTAYAPVSMSQDCTITSGGVITCLKTNNTAFSALATTTPGSGVATFLVTPSSANLLSAMTTKTGTNNLVFSTAPTLDSTLTIGAVSGTSGTINLLGTTSGTYTMVTTSTGAALGMSAPIRFANNTNALSFSQTTSSTGTSGLGLGVIGTGATEAWDFTGGTGTNLLKSGGPCALIATVTMNVSGTAVTFCTWTLPNAAKTWAWQCYGTYTTATATDTLSIGYTAAQAPTGVTGNAIIYSNLTGTSTAGSVTSTTSTANQTILTGASVSNVTNEPFMVSGVIQASATSGTFVLTGALTGSSPSGTINPGTTCNLY